MGELINYYILLSEIKYNDDPMKFGRIKCDIPGVIHSATTDEECMPWIRPFKMAGYQTFTKPLVGQKVWVLCSKVNYNEYWWFPFYETQDFVQEYISANYDNQPDVMHGRQGSAGDALFTYDDEHGYMLKLGENHINLKPDNTMEILANSCRIKIEGDKVYAGQGESIDECCLLGEKFKDNRTTLSNYFEQLSNVSKPSPLSPLSPLFKLIANELKKETIYSQNVFIN